MPKLIINKNIEAKLSTQEIKDTVGICPFNAIEFHNELSINAACKMCKLCVKNAPSGLFYISEDDKALSFLDKSSWNGIAVYIDHLDGVIHPVSLELIGKAKSLASSINHPVYAVFIGNSIKESAQNLLHYGVDEVFIYEHNKLKNFLIEPFTNIFENFINKVKPSSILIGSTLTGRSLAPRIAARFRTGLTADCTILDIKENSDLIQIRPAFGGNIMAQIITSNHRPQLATVRYKIFDPPGRNEFKSGKLTCLPFDEKLLESRIDIIEISKKDKKPTISDAEIIVACGRGLKSEKDLSMAFRLAELLNAEIACTRPLIESGWLDASRQIGLSGRSVKPKLIFTLGISGAVQFKAGMENSDCIISINNDIHAPIFDICHYAILGDIYEVLPILIKQLENLTLQNGGFANV